jgi:Spy/CpxP family protein refolding chaperone
MKIKLMPLLAGLITLSAVATPFVVKAQAQTPDQPTQTTHQHHGKWDKLGLSDQQKAQLEQIRKDTHTQIQAVLTPDQQAQIKTLMQNRQGQNHQAGQAHQGRQNLWASLNLTDAQKAKIKAIRDAQKSSMQAVLTPAQQQQLQQMRQQWQQQHQQQQNNK